jgi:hypothetical protein
MKLLFKRGVLAESEAIFYFDIPFKVEKKKEDEDEIRKPSYEILAIIFVKYEISPKI